MIRASVRECRCEHGLGSSVMASRHAFMHAHTSIWLNRSPRLSKALGHPPRIGRVSRRSVVACWLVDCCRLTCQSPVSCPLSVEAAIAWASCLPPHRSGLGKWLLAPSVYHCDALGNCVVPEDASRDEAARNMPSLLTFFSFYVRDTPVFNVTLRMFRPQLRLPTAASA